MKIVYDTKRKDTHRVVILDDKGIETPIPCYWIQIEEGYLVHSLRRWGNQKERDKITAKWKALMEKARKS
jgi:hypothetical protein